MGEDKGSRMRDYIGRRDLLEILASTIAAANPGVRNARTPVACGAFQGDENGAAKTHVGCPGQITGLRDHLLNRIVVSPGRTAITGNGWSFTELEQLV
jgi:hypothetical protein